MKLNSPRYKEYCFWGEGVKVERMHKLGFSNKLVVGGEGGILSIISYSKGGIDRYE